MKGLFGKSMTTWLDAKRERLTGFDVGNTLRIIELRECSAELAKVATLNYFLLAKCGIQNCQKMMESAVKQRSLIYAVCKDLKKYKVAEEYKTAFGRDIGALKKRVQHVKGICRRNIRLTRWEPFFAANGGYEQLFDFAVKFNPGEKTPLDPLFDRMVTWNALHPQEVAAHMQEIAPELELLERRAREQKEKEREQKRMAREAKKKAREAEKQIAKERLEEKRRKDKIEKEMGIK